LIMKLRKLTKDDVEIDLQIEEEDSDPGEWFSDPEDVSFARNGVASGNPWAWFRAIVTVRWHGFEASNSLGACSYRSEADFRRPGGYFDDMVAEALGALDLELEGRFAELCELIEEAAS